MSRKKILSVVGTRPNFMKMAPIAAALNQRPDEFEHLLVHTGQHYDDKMSEVFFEQLGVGAPDFKLDVGSGSHAAQTARIMERFEPVLEEVRPDVVLVPGDVNSTLAAALVAAKMNITVGHVEAGLRSFDWTMPEEINRIVADSVSQLLFIHSPEARTHLLESGHRDDEIFYVGNTMIDTLVAMREHIDADSTPDTLGLTRGEYVVVTLHRPALVDGPLLKEAIEQLSALAEHMTVVFPAHPRTTGNMEKAGIKADHPNLKIVAPLGYLEFLALVASAAGVLTDSGGIQEETTFLGIPCFTLRDNTERPVTVEMGTNTLLGLDPQRISEVPSLIETARSQPAEVPPFWDGHAAERVADVLAAERVVSPSY